MPLMANIAKRAAASAPTTSRTLPGLLALNRLEDGLSSSSSKSSPDKSPRASSSSPQFLCRRIGHILLFLPVSRHTARRQLSCGEITFGDLDGKLDVLRVACRSA